MTSITDENSAINILEKHAKPKGVIYLKIASK